MVRGHHLGGWAICDGLDVWISSIYFRCQDCTSISSHIYKLAIVVLFEGDDRSKQQEQSEDKMSSLMGFSGFGEQMDINLLKHWFSSDVAKLSI